MWLHVVGANPFNSAGEGLAQNIFNSWELNMDKQENWLMDDWGSSEKGYIYILVHVIGWS